MIRATQEEARVEIRHSATRAASLNSFQTITAPITEKGAELTKFASLLAPSSDWLNATIHCLHLPSIMMR